VRDFLYNVYGFWFKDGNEFAGEHDCLFVETSAKTGLYIRELFENIGLCENCLVYWVELIARALPKEIPVDANSDKTLKVKEKDGCSRC
jgi:2-hydroxy-3-keto-5-methylthiopentenyl-1-phosphate phosphatase